MGKKMNKTNTRRRQRPAPTLHRNILTKTILPLLVTTSTTQALNLRTHATTSTTTLTTDSISNLMGLPTYKSNPTTSSTSTTSLVETQETLVHVLQRKLGGQHQAVLPSSASSSSSSTKKSPAIDPAIVSIGQTIQASMAYGQPIAHPVNTAWNPLNQDHTPQAATNQITQLPYDSSLVPQYDDTSNPGYSAYPIVDGVVALAQMNEKNLNNQKEAPGVVETVPMKSSEEYAAQALDAPRGQPVANPSIMAGVSVVQHPSLSTIKEGPQPNPFATVSPDAASFATNPLAYHPQAQVSYPLFFVFHFIMYNFNSDYTF